MYIRESILAIIVGITIAVLIRIIYKKITGKDWGDYDK